LQAGIITTLILLFFFTAAVSQHRPFFINTTEADGLSDNHITCFYKDKTGYLWIGTENGLNRFDGREIKIYKPDGSKKNNLSNAFITSVAQDKAGHIWVATRKGLNRIDAFNDTIENFWPLEKKNSGLPSELLWDIFPETDTAVWVVMDSKPLVRYNPVTKQYYYFDFKKHLKENNIKYKSNYHSIFKIIPKSANEFWLATTDGIFSFNKTNGSFKLEYSVSLDRITFFHYNISADKLYCADENKVVYIYESGNKKITMLSADAKSNQNKYLLPYSAGKDGQFIPSPEGLLFVKTNNKIGAFISGEEKTTSSLPAGKINTVYKDRDNITWIGTEKGVSRFVPQLNENLNISFAKNLFFDPEFAMKNFLFFSNRNEWWAASFSDNKIWKVNDHTGEISEINKPSLYSNDTCYAFYYHHPDSIFLICKRVLLLYNYQNNKWSKISLPEIWNKASLTCMAIDGEGNYWLGTRRKGILVYNPRSKTVWVPDEKIFKEHIIHALQFDSKNNRIWIGSHDNGMYNYNIATKAFQKIQRNDASPFAIHSSLINDIALDKKNNVWAGTIEGGLAKYSISETPDKGVTNYEIQNGLPDNNVLSVTVGKKGEVYFTTIKGIGLISPDGNLKSFFSTATGLPYSRFIQSITSLPMEKVATTIDNNLFCFNPAALLQSRSNPLVINKVLLDDSVELYDNNSELQYNQNTIRFDFAMIDFVSPSAVEYFYKLEGFDKDWVSNGKQRSIRYSGLQQGDYIFKVKAKKSNGEWSEQIAEWEFEIKPPFWKTWWFRLICILCISYLLFYFARDRISKLKQREKFKRDYERKIAEVEMQALRAQMNPHFMFNSLNSINNFILKNDADNASGYLTKFSRLMRLILDNSRSEWVLLENELKALELYIELEAVRFDNAFAYTIEVAKDISLETVMMPPLLIQPYVENAIWHGLLHHKQPGGKLDIRLWKNNDTLYIEIEDNGVGRDEAKRLKSKTATKQKSHGMKITAERMDIVNKVYNVGAGVTITDLNNNGKQTGTRVLITLKYQTHDSHYSG
jgi:ligand-binding sensor domain-containing protein